MNKNIMNISLTDASNPNIVVIGTGYWGKNLVRNFSELNALYGICDENLELAESIAGKYQVKAFSLEMVLNSKDIDAVVIATPEATHANIAKQALLAGKHIFVEKPLALEIKDVEEIIKLSESLNLRLMVGHLMHYHPVYIHIKQMVKNNDLGNLQYIYSTRLNLGRVIKGQDVMWGFAPHDVSMILGIINEEPESVNCFGGSYLNNSIADLSNIHLNFKNNVKAHAFVSWLHPYKEQKFVVIGNKAMVAFDNNQPWDKKLQITYHDEKLLKSSVYPYVPKSEYITVAEAEPLKEESKHFIDCIKQNNTPLTDGKESLNVLKVLSKASKDLYQIM